MYSVLIQNAAVGGDDRSIFVSDEEPKYVATFFEGDDGHVATFRFVEFAPLNGRERGLMRVPLERVISVTQGHVRALV